MSQIVINDTTNKYGTVKYQDKLLLEETNNNKILLEETNNNKLVLEETNNNKLLLEEINIYNFKSFKGHHRINKLDNHISIIVGPNGSGKSNIIDSMLFVLGFKAKKMRHTILADLIYSGCLECYVELKFNRFKVKREIRKRSANTTSTYFINDKEESLTNTVTFLKENGIDLDNNRFLILQGEIETISMMGPMELLEYIEDCIGTSTYKDKIVTLEGLLQTHQSTVGLRESNLKFIENEFSFKKGKKEESLDILSMKKDSLRLKGRIVDYKKKIAEHRGNKLENELAQHKSNHSENTKKNKNLKKEIDSLTLKLDRMKDRHNDLENQMINIKKEKNRTENIKNKNKLNLSSLESKKEKLENELKLLTAEIKSFNKKKDEYLSELKKSSQEIKEFENKKFMIEADLNEKEEYLERENKIINLEAKLLKKINKKTETEVLMFKDIKERIKEYFPESVEDKILLKNSKDFIKNFNLNQNEFEILKNDILATKSEINKRKRNENEYKHLENKVKKENETLNVIMRPGVHGFLKNLGEIENEYDEAISASTKSLNSIVVDSTAIAEDCINLINKKKLNRTTFIILDKIAEVPILNDKLLLFKKIKCEKIYEKCFYFALRDTLVVKTLEEAKALAFGKVRRRVVTLDGKLLEKSGIMSGSKSKATFKSSIELEKILENMNNLLDSKIKEKLKLEQMRDICIKYVELFDRCNELSNNSDGEVDVIKKEINDIKNCNYNNLQITELVGELNLISEKIDYLVKRNQFLNEKLEGQPVDTTKNILLELETVNGSIDSIKKTMNEMDDIKDNSINNIEEEYKKFMKEYNEIKGLLNDSKKEASLFFEKEIENQNKIDEITEMLKEGRSIHNSCIEKKKDILNEIKMINNLLESKEDCISIRSKHNRNNLLESKHNRNNLLESKHNRNNLLESHNGNNLLESKHNNLLESKYNDLLKSKHYDLLKSKHNEFGLEEEDDIENYSEDQLRSKSKDLINNLNKMEEECLRMISKSKFHDNVTEDINVYKQIFNDYENTKKEYEEAKMIYDELIGNINKIRVELENMKNERFTIFMGGFTAINRNIKEIFNLITFGGNAELDLIDYLNPFSDGIILSIMPPKKAWKQVSNLSGGEKTLSSLSLIFALHKYRPSSFYIMDEVDAALDYRNVSIISQYISKIDSQLVIISLRNDMFEIGKVLVGVYKHSDVSKIVTLDVERCFSYQT